MGHRVAVCDTAGHLLACSNLEGHVIAGGPRLMGDGWWEFVSPDDLPRVLAWFLNGRSGDTVTYRQLSQVNGQPVMADITILKVPVGGVYLCYGAVRARQPPVPRPQHERHDRAG